MNDLKWVIKLRLSRIQAHTARFSTEVGVGVAAPNGRGKSIKVKTKWSFLISLLDLLYPSGGRPPSD